MRSSDSAAAPGPDAAVGGISGRGRPGGAAETAAAATVLLVPIEGGIARTADSGSNRLSTRANAGGSGMATGKVDRGARASGPDA